MTRPRLTTTIAIIIFQAHFGFSQPADKSESDTVRVTVSMKADGSRTVYKFDDAEHKAVATTTGPDGKVREKIRYQLDDAGRYSSGMVFGADGRLRLKSQYKYDNAGRLQEETQAAANDALLHKIVYDYDQQGKPIGYSIFDASGKLIGRTGAPPANSSPKPREKSGQR
jgi:hypothetical protein